MKQKGMLYLSAAQISFMVASYLTNLWLGRYLGPRVYGIYGVVITVMTALNITQVAGLPQAVSRTIASSSPEEFDSILQSGLRLQLVSTVSLAVLLFILAPLVALGLGDGTFTPYIRLVALIFPTYGIYAMFIGYYNGLHRFGKQALLNIVYASAKLICVIGLAFAFGLKGALLGFIISPIVGLLSALHVPRGVKKLYPYKNLILFSLPLIMFAFVSILQLSIDLLAVKRLLENNEVAGFYTAAQNIAIIPYLAISSVGLVLFPSVSRSLSQGKGDELSQNIHTSFRYVLLTLLPATAIMAGLASEIVKLLYSGAYLPAAAPLRILLLSYAFLSVFVTLANACNGMGKTKVSVYAGLVGVVITGAGCVILVPTYGMLGAAFASGMGAAFSCFITLIVLSRILQLAWPLKSIVRIGGAALTVFAISNYAQWPLLSLPLVGVALAGVFLCLLVVLREVSLEEVKNMFKFLERKRAGGVS